MSSCSSCGADIVWAITERGKKMPVDTQLTLGGNLLLLERDDGLHALVVEPYPDRLAYTSHFATCPQAAEWRKT